MKWGQDKPGATRSLATSNRLGNIIEPGQYRAETSYSPHSEHRLSGTFLQTPSIAFRHLPPNSEHRFPALSSKLRVSLSGTFLQTPSIAFRHLPPNSARFGYATEGALFISAQLSTDAVSALRKVRVLIRLWKQPSAQART